MSVKTLKDSARGAVKAAAVTATAMVAASVLSAGTAAAADKELTFEGEFPIIGIQTVKVVVHVDIPPNVTLGGPLDVPFTLDVNGGDAAADGLRLVGATKISGEIRAAARITVSNGLSVPLAVRLPIPDTPVPAQGPLTFQAKGGLKFTVPRGVPTGETKVNVEPKATSHIVTDSDLGEFDLDLVLAPPTQDTRLGTTQIVG